MLSPGGRVYELYMLLSLVRYISSRNDSSSYAVSTCRKFRFFHDVRTSAEFTFSFHDGRLATTFIFPAVSRLGALFLALAVALVQKHFLLPCRLSHTFLVSGSVPSVV